MNLKHVDNSRTVTLDSFSVCPQDEKNAIHFNGVIKKTTRNKYSVNGEFKFTDIAMGPIEVIDKTKKYKKKKCFFHHFFSISYHLRQHDVIST